jgi:hypothetical protein
VTSARREDRSHTFRLSTPWCQPKPVTPGPTLLGHECNNALVCPHICLWSDERRCYAASWRSLELKVSAFICDRFQGLATTFPCPFPPSSFCPGSILRTVLLDDDTKFENDCEVPGGLAILAPNFSTSCRSSICHPISSQTLARVITTVVSSCSPPWAEGCLCRCEWMVATHALRAQHRFAWTTTGEAIDGLAGRRALTLRSSSASRFRVIVSP